MKKQNKGLTLKELESLYKNAQDAFYSDMMKDFVIPNWKMIPLWILWFLKGCHSNISGHLKLYYVDFKKVRYILKIKEIKK